MDRFKTCIILLLLSLLRRSQAADNIEGQPETIYHDSECLNAQDLGMADGRIPDSAITASSEENKREAINARLGDHAGAWTASTANKFQYLSVDLGQRYLVTAVGTQGRKASYEYVTEYYLEFSDDGQTWRMYTNEFGMPRIFVGNDESYQTQKNTLPYPIVAQHIRFNPQRWQTRISMRVEGYGCLYESDPATFINSWISVDITQSDGKPIQTQDDTLKLRFKTDQTDGIIFYADGNQGDYFALELNRGFLYFHLNLGSTQYSDGATTLVGGSLLDDYQWHDVLITRSGTSIIFVVDRIESRKTTNGDFFRLDLDKKIYLGGVPTFNMKGLTALQNFQGCVENVVFNGLKIIRGALNGLRRYSVTNAVGFRCALTPVTPITFFDYDSYIRVTGGSTLPFRASLEFRTHNTNGILIYHSPTDDVEVKVLVNNDGHVYYRIKTRDDIIEDIVRNNDIDAPSTIFNDGLWHRFTIIIDSEKVDCTVDNNKKVSNRQMRSLTMGVDYYVGGFDSETSFLGCMRRIAIGDQITNLNVIAESDKKSVSVGSCSIRDRCIPNPCEHGGKCSQDWKSFTCNCDSTGYTGAVCHISAYSLSCVHYMMYAGSKNLQTTMIDVDGSGPLDPFTVECDIREEVEESSIFISHNSQQEIKVDGCENPGCYRRDVVYDADYDTLTEVIDRAISCQQYIHYRCNQSRLLATPVNVEPNGPEAYGWWVGRTYQPMYYWGGAGYGSHKCACGLDDVGCGDNTYTCHCDKPTRREEKDYGYLRDKDDLPVMQMFFGDTGTLTDAKVGWHKLDKLECIGDNLFENVITFRKHDATILLATFDAKSSGDIWFQFKTTIENGVILHNTGSVSGDEVLVRIFNGDTVQFSYNAGSGSQNIDYKSPSGLNDNKWHTVHIERNRKQAWLRVDDQTAITLDEAEEQGYRTLDLTTALTIGARTDNREGFVGCMRGLRVNGRLMDLRGMVERGEVTYGVSVGCIGKCDSNPCFHNGVCKEGYSGYTCDCAYTPFRGWMCGREVGCNMLKNYMIRLNFSEQHGFSGADGEYIRIGFISKFPEGILLQIKNEDNSEYISVEMNNDGGIKVVLDVGFGREEVNTPYENVGYTNGQQHEVIVRRTNRGRRLSVKVDNYNAGIGDWSGLPNSADTILDNPKFLYIGRNESSEGFEGCIYRMQFDNIYPLKRVFQDPVPQYVFTAPPGMVREDMCGYEEITQPPDPVEVRPGAGIVVNVTAPMEADEEMSAELKAKIVGGVVGGFVLLVIIVIVLLKLFIRSGEYRTFEARGADFTDNPDSAIMFNAAKQPDIQKRREWFI